MKKICCVGHITLDKIVTPSRTAYAAGGTAWYFAHGICSLGAQRDFSLVTALAPTEMTSVEELRSRGVAVKVQESRHTVYFENKYGVNQNERTQRVLAKADPFAVGSIEGVEADVFHLGSLLADDFPPALLQEISSKALLSVDAQGYLREVRGDKVFATDWKGKLDVLPYVGILKVNEYEMEALTGERDARAAARKLADWGVKEVVVTLGSEGSVVYYEGRFHEIPAYPPSEVVDATGCGDTYMTGYLYRRCHGDGPDGAGRFGAAMSTIKLEKTGPFSASVEDVEKIIVK